MLKRGLSLGYHFVNGAVTVVTVGGDWLGFGQGWWGRGVGVVSIAVSSVVALAGVTGRLVFVVVGID